METSLIAFIKRTIKSRNINIDFSDFIRDMTTLSWWPVDPWLTNRSFLTVHFSLKLATLRDSRNLAHPNTMCLLRAKNVEAIFILKNFIYKLVLPAIRSKLRRTLLFKPFDYHSYKPFVMASATKNQSANFILWVLYLVICYASFAKTAQSYRPHNSIDFGIYSLYHKLSKVRYNLTPV